MPGFKIASAHHPDFGSVEIHFQGANQPLAIVRYHSDHRPFRQETTIVPRSLLNALEMLDDIASSGSYLTGGYKLKPMNWNLDELRSEEKQLEELRKASKRRAVYAGTPSLGCLAQHLNELLDQNPFLAFYPVFICGTAWYIHIDEGQVCVLLDNELLYEDYELTQ